MAQIPRQQPEQNPTEYAPVERVTGIEARLAKTYSSERYEEFQEAVEKIIYRVLETDTAQIKLKGRIQTEIKDFLDKRAYQSKTFWIPTIIGLIAAFAAVLALFKK